MRADCYGRAFGATVSAGSIPQNRRRRTANVVAVYGKVAYGYDLEPILLIYDNAFSNGRLPRPGYCLRGGSARVIVTVKLSTACRGLAEMDLTSKVMAPGEVQVCRYFK